MTTDRGPLPQLGDRLFLTDGGIETVLMFHEGIDLPHFASFTLLADDAGRSRLRRYFEPYLEIAREHDLGFLLESATWRASPDWAERLGYSPDALADANRQAIALLEELRRDASGDTPMVISGCVGPRGDGYDPGAAVSAQEAADYHRTQIDSFAQTAADMVGAITINRVEEAIGIVWAARDAGLPVAISFTVETDGRLPTGQRLKDAIAQVDAETDAAPAYYMINCAHATHFDPVLEAGAPWLERLRGLRANASRLSHAELDEAPELDEGNPQEFGNQYAELRRRHPQLTVLGGCCGTDHRHVRAIAQGCTGGMLS